jgi:uncharacterized protein YbjT (DUF2867 family)
MARSLIVGCGCRGRELGGRLAQEGWAVRGTSRAEPGLAAIEAAGIEAALADPDLPATLLDLVGDVAVVHWLLGSAQGEPRLLEALHGSRLERMLERLVDTPVRGFVYEAAGSVPAPLLESGEAAVARAGERWRIPVAAVVADPADTGGWIDSMLAATLGLVGMPIEKST